MTGKEYPGVTIVLRKIAYALVDKDLHNNAVANRQMYLLTKDEGLVLVESAEYRLLPDQKRPGSKLWGWMYHTSQDSYRFDDRRIQDFYIVESGL